MDDVIAVARAVDRLAQRMRAERRAGGKTTLLMVSVLSHLDRQGAMTAGRLAELQRLTPQALTRTLRRLEDEGLISRRPDDDDRRQVRLILTPAGRELLAAELRPRAVWLAKAMERLSTTEREVLMLAAALMEDFVAGSPQAGS